MVKHFYLLLGKIQTSKVLVALVMKVTFKPPVTIPLVLLRRVREPVVPLIRERYVIRNGDINLLEIAANLVSSNKRQSKGIIVRIRRVQHRLAYLTVVFGRPFALDLKY